MSKSRWTAEQKNEIIKQYLSGEGSYATIAKVNAVGEKTLKDWVHRYQEQGKLGFVKKAGNKHYSKEFKTKCVEAGSVDDVVAKYNISSRSVLNGWIMKYNANMELKDYEPKREVYMAEARRKTTLEERKEIVAYCISVLIMALLRTSGAL